MALRSTICKAALSIADMDRGRYGDHDLTLALHPSETEERMMVRVLAFALHADDGLAFGRGLSTEDEPDLWRRDDTGAIVHWIDVGWPDERRVRRACGRAERVSVLAYGGAKTEAWWAQNGSLLARNSNLDVAAVPRQASAGLAALARRAMRLNVTVQDGRIWVGDDSGGVDFELRALSPVAA
jgi:uncharacterized protein YaeQ